MKTVANSLLLAVSMAFMASCNDNLNAPEVTDHEFSVDENSKTGFIIGVVIAYDLDQGQTVSFKIAEGNEDGTFEIDQIGGHVSVANSELLDYELHTHLAFTVVVTDDHPKDPLESTSVVTVLINDLNEFAPVIEDQEFEIHEHPEMGALIGEVAASDQEEHQALHFSILSGNDNQYVLLDAETGSLIVNDPTAFDVDFNTEIKMDVVVRDVHLDSKTDTANIIVNILPA